MVKRCANLARMSLTPEERALRARIAAHEKWAQTPDRTAATAAARRGFESRWERQVDPEGKLDPAARLAMAESAKKAHYLRMALASARKRSKAKALLGEAETAEREMRDHDQT